METELACQAKLQEIDKLRAKIAILETQCQSHNASRHKQHSHSSHTNPGKSVPGTQHPTSSAVRQHHIPGLTSKPTPSPQHPSAITLGQLRKDDPLLNVTDIQLWEHVIYDIGIS